MRIIQQKRKIQERNEYKCATILNCTYSWHLIYRWSNFCKYNTLLWYVRLREIGLIYLQFGVIPPFCSFFLFSKDWRASLCYLIVKYTWRRCRTCLVSMGELLCQWKHFMPTRGITDQSDALLQYIISCKQNMWWCRILLQCYHCKHSLWVVFN